MKNVEHKLWKVTRMSFLKARKANKIQEKEKSRPKPKINVEKNTSSIIGMSGHCCQNFKSG